MNLKRQSHYLTTRTHDSHHAFPLGHINTYTVVHKITPIQFSATGIHLFLAADSIYWVTRTLRYTGRLYLLKSNATTRGWLTVLITDMEAPERKGQSVTPLIVA